MTAPPDDCLARNEWICGEYLTTRRQILLDAVLQHLQLTVISVLVGLALAIPLAVLARRWRWSAGPVLGVTTILYTIPSLATSDTSKLRSSTAVVPSGYRLVTCSNRIMPSRQPGRFQPALQRRPTG